MVLKYKVKIADYMYRQQTTKFASIFIFCSHKLPFEKVRDTLVYCLAAEIESVLLYEAYISVNKLYPYWEYDDFCLESFDSSKLI